MKEKFLLILKELERRYSHPFAWLPFMKKRLCLRQGICAAMDYIILNHLEWNPTILEKPFFNVMLIEEAAQYGGLELNDDLLLWRAGKIKPRLKTIRAMIKRIEKS